MQDEQILAYASSKNITFRGELNTGMTKQEWQALSDAERDEVVTQMVWELVQIWEKD